MQYRILVIEDHKDMLDNVSEILELAGYAVGKALNGKEGINKALAFMPHLILCDIMMPELDGFGVLKICSGNEQLKNIPFVFMSAKSDKEDFRKGMSLGADDYLVKPFQDVQLLETVETRLKKLTNKEDAEIHNVANFESIFNIEKAHKMLYDAIKNEKLLTYENKSTLFVAHSFPHYVYLLKKGKVKTYMLNEQGKELITGLYGPEDFIGFTDVLGHKNYIEFARFIENGECIAIPRNHFLKIHINHKEISVYTQYKMSFSVNIRKERLLYMAYNSVRKRTADCLVWLCEVYNKENKYPFEIHFSREDLASLVGTAKESLIRTLSSFKEEGLIDTHASSLIIFDKNILINIIG
ncbi:MAG: response regulator [Chitinophagales bacterium]|nr:response regulator [Chitinophagales bacterium]